MKILKDETYNSLTKQIKELKKENEDLELHNNQQSNILRDNRKEFASFVTNVKMTFSIKRLIVGRKASGKTTFIKEILHKIPNYFVIDTNNEYNEVAEDKKFVPAEKTSYDDLLEQIKQVVLDNKDKTLIIEETMIGEGFSHWFLLNSRDINFIMISQCKRRIEPFIHDIDFIYDFGTIDNFKGSVNENKIMRFEKKKDYVLDKSNSFKTESKTIKALGLFTIFALGFAMIISND